MDFDSQAKLLEQRRNRFLQQQDVQGPDGQMVGGRYVAANPLEYLAAGLRGYGGMRGEQLANQELKDLQTQKQSAIANALRTFGEKANPSQAGTGATNLVNDALPPEMQIGAMPKMAPRQPDMTGAYQALADSGVSDLQKAGMQGFLQMPQMQAQAQAREDDRAFRQQEAQATRDARAQELQMRMQDQRASQQERLAAQKELREMQIQAQKDTQRMIASNRPERQAQIIQTDAGPMQLVNGKAVPIIGPDGKPVMVKAAGATGAPAGAKAQDARDALATIDMAEKLIGEATGSGIGSAVDSTAAFFGKSTKGAQAAAQLKALEGDLVAKMPKMSGPQSDKDVLLYRQMAGQIGDPSVPQETKRAALVSIREMQNRYASGGAGATGSWEAPAAPKARMKFDAQGNPIQ